MQRTERNIDKNTSARQDLKKYPLVEVTRTFQAPVERVWRTWAEPELLKQWWGPETYSCPDAKIDFREGGENHIAMKGPDGKVIWGGGKYIEIDPNKKLVYTDHFADEKGNPISANDAGMPGDWPGESLVTVEFEDLGNNQTRMHVAHEGIPKEMHDDCVKGWDSSFDKMQRLVERQ